MKYKEEEGGRKGFFHQVCERSFSAFSDEFYEASLIYCENLDTWGESYHKLQTEFLREVAKDFLETADSWEKKNG